jgi:hypothetical protein
MSDRIIRRLKKLEANGHFTMPLPSADNPWTTAADLDSLYDLLANGTPMTERLPATPATVQAVDALYDTIEADRVSRIRSRQADAPETNGEQPDS